MAGVEYRKFLTIKNMILMLFSLIFLGESVIRKMISISVETGIRMNYLEPVNLILSDSFHAMIIPVTFIVLFSGFPDKSSNGAFQMIRISRTTWLLGQLLYAVFGGIFYLVFVSAGCILWTGKSGYFSTAWSAFMTDLYSQYPEIYGADINYFLGAGTVGQGKPAGVFVVSCFLMLLYLVTMAQFLCLFCLARWKRFGLFFCMALTVFGATAVSFLGDIKWVFPLAHSIFGIHFHEFFAEPVLKLRSSIFYFLALNIILGTANWMTAKRCRIGDDCE